jgi:hypothetical protein
MKTLIIFNPTDDKMQFIILEGDYSRFNGAMINSTNGNGYEEEFNKMFFDENDGRWNYEMSDDVSLIENKQWDKVAIVTWLP